MRYDATQMADLKTRETELRKEVAQLSKQMHDRRHGGDTWTPEMSAQHERDAIDHGVAERNLKIVRADIQAMNNVRPLGKAGREAPLRRFLQGGFEDLGEDRKMFSAPDSARSWLPKLPNMEMFYLPADREMRAAALGLPAPRQMALASDTTAGSAMTPVTVQPPVDTLDFIGGAMTAYSRFTSADGAPSRVPQFDTAAQTGRILTGQGASVQARAIPDPTNVEFTARTGTSDFIDIPMEAVTDVGFDIVGWAFRQVERRLMRAWNTALTTNDHSGSPHGSIGTATAGTKSGTAGGFSANNLIDLEYEVDRAYRDPMGEGVGAGFRLEGQGMIGYMVADGAEKEMKKFMDTQNRPLWLVSLREGVPPTFGGHPVMVNGAMADPVDTSQTSVAFGNFASFGLRVVGGTAIYRFFDSGTAATYSTRIVGFNRMDGKVRLPLSSNKNPAIAVLPLDD